MQNKFTILQELEEISPVVATIGNRNVYSVPDGYFNSLPAVALAKVQVAGLQAKPVPYSVPQGYFDSLAGNVMAKINAQAQSNEEAKEVESEIAGLVFMPTPYTVPAGYFDGLTGNVMAKIKAQAQPNNEVEYVEDEIAGIAFMPMPYTVPVGYFDSLARNVMAKIRGKESSNAIARELSEISSLQLIAMPYNVPANYFTTLADNVMATIKAGETAIAGNEVFEELEQIAPILNTISKQMPYSVPDGYFQQFSVNVTVEAPQAKVISMASRTRKWVTYAAAACITVLLGIGGYLLIPGSNIKPPIPDKVDVAQTPPIDVQKALATVSDDDLNAYLNSDPSASGDAEPAVLDDQAPDVQTQIEDMSVQELQQYLKENSDPSEKSGKHI